LAQVRSRFALVSVAPVPSYPNQIAVEASDPYEVSREMPTSGWEADRVGPAPTTLMFRNLPRKYTGEHILREVELVVGPGEVDFAYLPWSDQCEPPASSRNIGYAFVNFVRSETMYKAMAGMQGKAWVLVESERRVKVLVAYVQGLPANLAQCERRIAPHFGSKPVFPLVFLGGTRQVSFKDAVGLLSSGRLCPVASDGLDAHNVYAHGHLCLHDQQAQQQQQHGHQCDLERATALPQMPKQVAAPPMDREPWASCSMDLKVMSRTSLGDEQIFDDDSDVASDHGWSSSSVSDAWDIARHCPEAPLSADLCRPSAAVDPGQQQPSWARPGFHGLISNPACAPGPPEPTKPAQDVRQRLLRSPGYSKAWEEVNFCLRELLRRSGRYPH